MLVAVAMISPGRPGSASCGGMGGGNVGGVPANPDLPVAQSGRSSEGGAGAMVPPGAYCLLASAACCRSVSRSGAAAAAGAAAAGADSGAASPSDVMADVPTGLSGFQIGARPRTVIVGVDVDVT